MTGIRGLTSIGSTALSILLLACAGMGPDIDFEVDVPYTVADEQWPRTIGQLLGPPLVQGNKITTLVNGDQFYPAMLAAITNARESICFETHTYATGPIVDQFTEALTERARAGVSVHMIVDWFGSQDMERETVKTLMESKVEIREYQGPRWNTVNKMNNRTHRKLLIVDGKVAFTGGPGIGQMWAGNAEDPDHWRDTAYQVEGPVVAQLQAAFLDNWMRVDPNVLHDRQYFPPLKPAGDLPAQMFRSSPREGSDSLQLMYLMSISAAKRKIIIQTPYFAPDRHAIKEILRARERGVQIEMMLPGKHIDVKSVRYASRELYGKLLRAGVRIYEYQPTMMHCKLMIVDDRWVSVGSMNFDNRSFRLNDEANLNILDAEFARRQSEIFEADKVVCKEITLETWEDRPWSERLAGLLLLPFRPQL